MSVALIVGGTGTLAKQVIPVLLRNPQIERIRILSRGEHAQTEMIEKLEQRNKLDFFIGDIRDPERLLRASDGCDMVFHFAAMKSIDHAEYNPWEAVQTNIIGTKNVIDACLKNEVERAIFASTDKAVAALNLYGATKLVAEKLFIQGNIGRHRTKFSVARWGNMLGSNGSVLNKWKSRSLLGQSLQLTDKEMTRFFILPQRAAEFVVARLYEANGGEVFIPKMKSCTMPGLLEAFSRYMGKTDTKIEWIGTRPGEKIHEVLISEDEIPLVTDCEDYFIRWPNQNLFPVLRRGAPVDRMFSSFNCERFTDQELEELVRCQLG